MDKKGQLTRSRLQTRPAHLGLMVPPRVHSVFSFPGTMGSVVLVE